MPLPLPANPFPVTWRSRIGRRLTAWWRGQEHDRTTVGLACSLGIMAGLLPLWSPLAFILIVAVYLLRAQLMLFLAVATLARLASLGLNYPAWYLGEGLLNLETLRPLWQWVLQAPVLAWFGLDGYLTLGSLVLAGVLAPVGWLAVQRRLAHWGRGPWLRRWPIARCVALCGLLVAILAGFSDELARREVERLGRQKLGTDVHVREASFDLWSGNLVLSGLQIKHSSRLYGIAWGEHFTARVGLVPLLQRRVVVSQLEADEVTFRVRRERDGALNIAPVRSPVPVASPAHAPVSSPTGELPGRPPTKGEGQGAPSPSSLSAGDLASALGSYLGRRFWDLRNSTAALKRDMGWDGQARHLWDDLPPVVVLEQMRVKRFLLVFEDAARPGVRLPTFEEVTLDVANFSSNPRRYGPPMTLSGQGHLSGHPQARIEVGLVFGFPSAGGHEHRLNVRALDVPLASLRGLYDQTAAIVPADGRCSLMASAVLTDWQLEGQAIAQVHALRCEAPAPSATVLEDLPAGAVAEGLTRFAARHPFEVTARLGGPLHDPALHWNRSQLVQQLEEGLTWAGRVVVLDQLDQELDRLRQLPDWRCQLLEQAARREIRAARSALKQGPAKAREHFRRLERIQAQLPDRS